MLANANQMHGVNNAGRFYGCKSGFIKVSVSLKQQGEVFFKGRAEIN